MNVFNISDDYNDFINCTNNENENNPIIKYVLLSIPANIILFSLIGSVIYTMIKHLTTNK